MAAYIPDISILQTRELNIRRGQWEMRRRRKLGFMMKFVLLSLGVGSPRAVFSMIEV